MHRTLTWHHSWTEPNLAQNHDLASQLVIVGQDSSMTKMERRWRRMNPTWHHSWTQNPREFSDKDLAMSWEKLDKIVLFQRWEKMEEDATEPNLAS